MEKLIFKEGMDLSGKLFVIGGYVCFSKSLNWSVNRLLATDRNKPIIGIFLGKVEKYLEKDLYFKCFIYGQVWYCIFGKSFFLERKNIIKILG